MQNRLVDCLHKNSKIVISFSASFLYFAFMYRFYAIDYYAPDFSLYHYFFLEGFKAKDGFSSLFILISSLLGEYPSQLVLGCLLLLTFSLFNFGFFILKMFNKQTKKAIIAFCVLYGCGIWYYFYGKLFYDFPFSAYVYSLCLLCVTKIIDKSSDDRLWYVFSGLCGFLMSWKMYNIFCFAGLGLLLLCKDKTRKYFIVFIKNKTRAMLACLWCVIGYLLGNYNLLISPYETLKGIRAYPATSSILGFFLIKSHVIWDHVGDIPFNLSVMNLLSAVSILFILPVIAKKVWYLLTAVFMSACFLIFISKFSPGYAWHGFTFGLYIITFAVFLFSEINIESITKGSIVVIMVIIQLISCFGCYIPIQENWFEKTEQSEKILYENQLEIYSDIENSINNRIGESTYMIEVAIKRYRPVSTSELRRNKRYLFVKTGHRFVDPLQAANVFEWNYVTQRTNYTETNPEYIIWVIPNPLMTIGDVVQINKYDGYNIISIDKGNNYSIILVKNNE